MAEREQMLHTKLESMEGAFTNLLPPGHEHAIQIVDADFYECVCCPAPMRGNGKRSIGKAFANVLHHVSSRQHLLNIAPWARAKRKAQLLGRLRFLARLAGRVVLWHARAAERAYAPGGQGFKEARACYEATRKSIRF